MLKRITTALCCLGAVSLCTLQASAQTSGDSTRYQLVTHDFSASGLITIDQVRAKPEADPAPVREVETRIVAIAETAPLPKQDTLPDYAISLASGFSSETTLPATPNLLRWTAFENTQFAPGSYSSPTPQFGIQDRASFANTPMLTAINLALSERDRSRPGQRDYIDVSTRFAFSAPREQTGLRVDLGFSPSAAFFEDNDVSVRRLGAEFRLGQNFDQRGSTDRPKSWYIFAGAEGEALVWDTGATGFNPSSLLSFNSFTLRDRVTVGDVQIGVSVERFGGQFSLSWVRREINFGDPAFENRFIENFGGVSFTLSR
ncbi:MAG: hypothetical protein AAFX02_02425 [Pseudomonadota bacterium]